MKRKKRNEKPRQTLLIVTSGEAESLYFSQMRKDSRYTNMTIIWDSEAQSAEDLIKRAAKERTRQKFDSVWCFFGLQNLELNDQQLAEAQALAKKRKVQLAWLNPDLSLWYLLHLQAPRALINDGSLIASALRGILPEFDTSPEYLLGAGSALHLKLFPYKAQAVVNAGAYNQLASQAGLATAPVNMTKLINDISTVCGTADMTHNQKLIGLKNN
ncbi:MAG: RloB family protein [Sphaerochaetaceae bacterium]